MLFTEYHSTLKPVSTAASRFGSDFYCRLYSAPVPDEPGSGLLADTTGRFYFSSPQMHRSLSGDQVILLDGEIDNSQQLRERYFPQSEAMEDSALIGHLYEKMGEAFLERLRGPYALAIWDSQLDRLLVCRSVVGQCTIYFTQSQGALHCSSSLRRLCSALPEMPTVDEGALRAYLRWGGVWAPNTLLRGIQAVCASEWISWSGDDLKSGKTWHLPPMPRWDIDILRAEALVDEKLSDAIAQSLGPMNEPGCLLSGSLNSSTLVTYGQKQRRPGQGLTTFSLSSYFNSRRESRLSKQVAQLCRAELVEVWPRDDAARTVQEIASILDCPSGNSGLIRFHLLMSARENSSDGVLAGFGGDELFAGRPYHLMTNVPALIKLLPTVLRNSLLGQPSGALGGLTDPCEIYRFWAENFSSGQVEALTGVSDESNTFNCKEGNDPLRTFVQLDLCHRLPDLLVSSLERVARGSGRKLRLPFLNRDLVELTCLIPRRFVLNGLASKFILRRLLQKSMPPHVLHELLECHDRLFTRWLSHDLREMLLDTLAGPRSLTAGMLSRDELASMLSAHFRGENNLSNPLWSLLVLELWWKSIKDSSGGLL